MKMAQDLIKDYQYRSGEMLGGFNARLQGQSSLQALEGIPHGSRWGERFSGWDWANDWIMEGKIYSIHDFHSNSECGHHAFIYGGMWACNHCNSDQFDKPWWEVKVMKDGDAWCCVGKHFENLQESDCYAFGDTRDKALDNYADLMSTVKG